MGELEAWGGPASQSSRIRPQAQPGDPSTAFALPPGDAPASCPITPPPPRLLPQWRLRCLWSQWWFREQSPRLIDDPAPEPIAHSQARSAPASLHPDFPGDRTEGGGSPSFLFFSVREGGVWRGGSERKGGSLDGEQFSRKVALAAQMAPPACDSGAHVPPLPFLLALKALSLGGQSPRSHAACPSEGHPPALPDEDQGSAWL